MDSLTFADKPPVCSFRETGMLKARAPAQGKKYGFWGSGLEI